jgi:hypothetical protein
MRYCNQTYYLATLFDSMQKCDCHVKNKFKISCKDPQGLGHRYFAEDKDCSNYSPGGHWFPLCTYSKNLKKSSCLKVQGLELCMSYAICNSLIIM